MRLKRLLLGTALALSFAVTAPTEAKADPITASVVAFAGFTAGTTAAAVATFVVNSALYAAGSFAISKAAQALGLNKQAAQERQASVTSLTLGESPREMVIGQACVGGTLVDAFNFDGKYGTDKVTRCIALADHAVDSIIGFYVDDTYYPWTNNGLQSRFSSKLSIDFRNALPNGYDPPQHVRENGAWNFSDRLASITHVWVDHFYDEQVWTQGHPRLRFVLRGLKVYDPRYDPAYGYTGPNPQTWENRASHRFSTNAVLCRYAYQRGVYAEGRHGQAQHLLFGRGLTAAEAPPERIIAWANLCDELVDGENRYTTNGVISTAQSHAEVEELFAAATAGVIVQREGGIEVEPGHAKAVVATITDDDLVVGEAISYSDFLPDTDGGRVNTVLPRYVEPAQGWKDHGAPILRDAADLLADGGPREQTLPLALVTSVKQAVRVGEIARRKARLERRDAIVLPPRFAGIEEGDWIAWQSKRRHGGATVRYRVTRFNLGPDWRNRLALEEIASSVFGVPDPVEDRAELPPTPAPIDALQLFGVTAEAITLAGETSTLPAVRVRWDVVSEGGEYVLTTALTAIRAEVRAILSDPDGNPLEGIAHTRIDDLGAGVAVITNGVGPDQELQVRLVPIGDPSRPVLPSNWITVLTTPVTAAVDPASIPIDIIVDDVLDQIGDGLADLDKSEEAAELIIETILNERDALEREADERLKADTGVLNEAIWRATEEVAEAMNLVYTKAQTDQGLATTLQAATAETDKLRSESSLLFSTKTERSSGDATALAQAKSYTDDFKTQASFTYATQVAMGQAAANTLSEAKSYSDGKLSTAMNTVYTKAQTDTGLATTLQQATSKSSADLQAAQLLLATKAERENGDAATLSQAKAQVDAFRSEASNLFAAQSALNGVSATASLALTTAQEAKENSNDSRVVLLADAEGGRPAMLGLRSGTNGNQAVLVAPEIILGTNAQGEVVPVLRLVDGTARVAERLYVGMPGTGEVLIDAPNQRIEIRDPQGRLKFRMGRLS